MSFYAPLDIKSWLFLFLCTIFDSTTYVEEAIEEATAIFLKIIDDNYNQVMVSMHKSFKNEYEWKRVSKS